MKCEIKFLLSELQCVFNFASCFFLVSIDYNYCFELRWKVPDVGSTCCVFFIIALWKKLLIMKYTNRKIKM